MRGKTGPEAATDELLMRRVARNDLDAMAELMQRHGQAALNVAYRFTGDRAESEDIVQEAFLRLLSRAGHYRPSASLRTFLFGIIHNLCIDFYRRKRPVLAESLPRVADADEGPRASLESAERQGIVRAAIDALPPRQRTAIVLKHYEGLSYAEIARVLECSISAVDALLARARQTLKERLRGIM
jgi:RNA polymerase sigma-70 factor (ECF subfamily)